MKKRLFALVACAFVLPVLLFSACKPESGATGDAEEEKDPIKTTFTLSDCVFTSFSAQDYDGDIIDQTVFGDYAVTMINVWGTFCPPCIDEVPALAELNREYADRGFQVIGIPINSNLTSATRDVITDYRADFRQIKVSNNIKPFISAIKSFPHTIFVNTEGKQIGDAYSTAKSKDEWKKIIDVVLEFANKVI